MVTRGRRGPFAAMDAAGNESVDVTLQSALGFSPGRSSTSSVSRRSARSRHRDRLATPPTPAGSPLAEGRRERLVEDVLDAWRAEADRGAGEAVGGWQRAWAEAEREIFRAAPRSRTASRGDDDVPGLHPFDRDMAEQRRRAVVDEGSWADVRALSLTDVAASLCSASVAAREEVVEEVEEEVVVVEETRSRPVFVERPVFTAKAKAKAKDDPFAAFRESMDDVGRVVDSVRRGMERLKGHGAWREAPGDDDRVWLRSSRQSEVSSSSGIAGAQWTPQRARSVVSCGDASTQTIAEIGVQTDPMEDGGGEATMDITGRHVPCTPRAPADDSSFSSLMASAERLVEAEEEEETMAVSMLSSARHSPARHSPVRRRDSAAARFADAYRASLSPAPADDHSALLARQRSQLHELLGEQQRLVDSLSQLPASAAASQLSTSAASPVSSPAPRRPPLAPAETHEAPRADAARPQGDLLARFEAAVCAVDPNLWQ